MVYGGAMRGLGMQIQATVILLVAFYFIAFPCTYAFAFHFNLGLEGLWLGPVCGSTMEFLIFILAFQLWLDWNKIIEEVH